MTDPDAAALIQRAELTADRFEEMAGDCLAADGDDAAKYWVGSSHFLDTAQLVRDLLALLTARETALQQLRVMGDVPVSNTPRTSTDRRGVAAARGEKPDPSPDQLVSRQLQQEKK